MVSYKKVQPKFTRGVKFVQGGRIPHPLNEALLILMHCAREGGGGNDLLPKVREGCHH